MTVARVGIHPRIPTGNFDTYLPYSGNSYNASQHITKSYLQKFQEKFSNNTNIVLVNQGEEISRYVSVKHILNGNFKSVDIELAPAKYQHLDPVFSKGFSTLTRLQELNANQLVSKYLQYHQRLTKFSQRYTYPNDSRDHGYFDAVKRFWYQWGTDMPAPPDDLHQDLYAEFDRLFESLLSVLLPVTDTIGMTADRVRENLMFRINHNPPDSVLIDNLLVNRHADSSVLTVWLHQNLTGGCIDFGQEHVVNSCAIEEIHDMQNQILLFPGFDYCDQAHCMTAATYHSVEQKTDQHRVSVVAFLKY
jgi:hypothetical protein